MNDLYVPIYKYKQNTYPVNQGIVWTDWTFSMNPISQFIHIMQDSQQPFRFLGTVSGTHISFQGDIIHSNMTSIKWNTGLQYTYSYYLYNNDKHVYANANLQLCLSENQPKEKTTLFTESFVKNSNITQYDLCHFLIYHELEYYNIYENNPDCSCKKLIDTTQQSPHIRVAHNTDNNQIQIMFRDYVMYQETQTQINSEDEGEDEANNEKIELKTNGENMNFAYCTT